VGIFDNATPEGAFDLTGNADTWTSTLLRDYPYDAADGREATANPPGVRRGLRGGSWYDGRRHARAVSRYRSNPLFRFINFGFRLVRAPSL
jgi:formylglycine-generating enzyme required for sulfatase activity